MSRAMSTSDKQTKVVWEGTKPTTDQQKKMQENALAAVQGEPVLAAGTKLVKFKGSGSKTKDGKNEGTEATVHFMGENGKKIIGGKVDSTWVTFSGGRYKPYYRDKE
ncbi:hypothetical protein LTR56_003620 [Elasticomyces elasticus]|nr:hypothetical protein LTR56_003620 [Elasticomyces elasticus]KAK4927271.1 hypothetical protein LTR49_005936 [Elasticomyces elasticus]KAK5767323.1 hypothetical protein LTS12_002476 [Elasticomyces elasticus]